MGGCTSRSLLSEVIATSVKQQFGHGDDALASATLNPAYQYLRVQAEGKPAALLVLGYVDPHPDGDVEVWYSADHEVIKTQNGRIVATAGLATDWTTVRFTAPPSAWSDRPPADRAFSRVRDQMPGYRFNLTDQLAQSRLNGDLPSIKLPSSLPATLAARYVWIREEQVGTVTAPPPPGTWTTPRLSKKMLLWPICSANVERSGFNPATECELPAVR